MIIIIILLSQPVQNEREIYDIKIETLKSYDHPLIPHNTPIMFS
jgi:hypothetical protein